MAEYNLTKGAGAAIDGRFGGSLLNILAVIDFSSTNLNSGSGVVQNDIINLINIPANTLVLGVHAECRSGQTPDELSSNLADLDIGDGADPDGFHDGLDLTAAVNAYNGIGTVPTLVEGTPNTFTGFAMGKYYSAADTLDATIKTNATIITGVLAVRMLAVAMHQNRNVAAA